MSSVRIESNNSAGVRRLSRWHPYSLPSPAAPPGPSGESSSSSPVSAKPSLATRNALSSAFRPPRCVLATRSAPLEFVSIVRAEHGLPAPRRDAANALLSKEDKLRSARCLVERAMNILSSAWKTVETSPFPVASTSPGDAVATPSSVNSSHSAPPPPSPYDGSQYPYQSTAEHMPLRHFIHEVLRRSRTNFITLQTALCYVEAIAARLPTLVKEEAQFMLKRAEPGYVPQPDDENPEVPALPSPLLCPRRTFLASILLASKFLQDRSYSNKAWAKLTGLAAREVGRCERVLCAALDYRLWVGKGSEPAPVIEGLDMAPVVAIDATYQPEPARAAPQMLRKTRSDVALASRAAAVDVPTPRPVKQLPLRAYKTLAAIPATIAPIDEPVAGPSTWGDAALVHLPPMLTHAPTELQLSCSQSQSQDYPDNASSSSLSPGLSYTQSSSADSVSSFDPSTPEDMDAGPHGQEFMPHHAYGDCPKAAAAYNLDNMPSAAMVAEPVGGNGY